MIASSCRDSLRAHIYYLDASTVVYVVRSSASLPNYEGAFCCGRVNFARPLRHRRVFARATLVNPVNPAQSVSCIRAVHIHASSLWLCLTLSATCLYWESERGTVKKLRTIMQKNQSVMIPMPWTRTTTVTTT